MASSKHPNGHSQNSPEDIINLILQDHTPLKELIQIMKDEDANFTAKKSAFLRFAPKLKAHAKPEERTWYMNLKQEQGMNVEGLEGDIEHALADQLCEELKDTDSEDMFMAKVKVLAELVEHHIEEEEEDMLPEFKRMSTVEERVELGIRYLAFQAEVEEYGGIAEPAPRATTPTTHFRL